jgi:hypothetical protein
MHVGTVKEMWDKHISSYEGIEKAKDAKLQIYRVQFEQLKMKEDETVGKYFLRVEELVNAMKALAEKIEEPCLVQKILQGRTVVLYYIIGILVGPFYLRVDSRA